MPAFYQADYAKRKALSLDLAFEVDVEDGHIEVERRFAVFFIFVAEAEEFAVQQNFNGIGSLGAGLHANLFVAESAAQKILNLDHFIGCYLHAVSVAAVHLPLREGCDRKMGRRINQALSPRPRKSQRKAVFYR